MVPSEVACSAKGRFGNPSDEELLQTYRPPAYNPPYPVAINPTFSSEVFKKKADQWMKSLKMYTIFSPKIYQMLVSMEISGLAARVYLEAPEQGLEWAWKFFHMLWIWDDTLDLALDATEIGKSPEKALSPLLDMNLMILWSFPDDRALRTGLEPFLSQFEGQELEEKIRYIESVLAEGKAHPGTVYSKPTSNIICNVYGDVWKEFVTTYSPEFCLRLAHSVQRWVLGCLQETENRKSKIVPSSIDHYIQIRRGSSAVDTSVVLVDFVYGLNTPDTWFYSPEMKSLMEALNDIGSWHNDIWSFKREVLVEKDMSNMVLAVSVHLKVSYTEAAEITTQMVYDRISDLEQTATVLESVTPPEYRRNLELYLLTARSWVSGQHDWHSKCIRYR